MSSHTTNADTTITINVAGTHTHTRTHIASYATSVLSYRPCLLTSIKRIAPRKELIAIWNRDLLYVDLASFIEESQALQLVEEISTLDWLPIAPRDVSICCSWSTSTHDDDDRHWWGPCSCEAISQGTTLRRLVVRCCCCFAVLIDQNATRSRLSSSTRAAMNNNRPRLGNMLSNTRSLSWARSTCTSVWPSERVSQLAMRYGSLRRCCVNAEQQSTRRRQWRFSAIKRQQRALVRASDSNAAPAPMAMLLTMRMEVVAAARRTMSRRSSMTMVRMTQTGPCYASRDRSYHWHTWPSWHRHLSQEGGLEGRLLQPVRIRHDGR